MLHAFGLLFVCYDEPSEFLCSLVPRYATSDLPGQQIYSQEQAVFYWENLEEQAASTAQPPPKRERKRPNVASYITEVIRNELKKMSPSTLQMITPDMMSHSLRRGAAAYANASPKLAIQWISTRGNESPDLPVVTPSVGDLRDRLSVMELTNSSRCVTSCSDMVLVILKLVSTLPKT
ncbi:hypothetical protein PHMEG_00040462 [Phytophthora megakarya]|uniref:Uncharacterized protein n=1 Tax=Phytophthora megakarya TaxID=4795 RepID=A0A225UDQ5_9STRA|nr:hypothetical protein PHMEG_00040462 [Phytophthora megakarya]